MRKYKKYSYNGPVMRFDRCIDDQFKAETMAISEERARSNIIFQYKKANNLIPSTNISLPEKLVLAE